MEQCIAILKALSDKTRLRILCAMQRACRELCICEIMDVIEMAQCNVSRHVKELRHAGLVQERKEGRFVFYRLAPAESTFHRQVLKTMETVDDPLLSEDGRRLKARLSLRKDDRCVVGIKKRGCC